MQLSISGDKKDDKDDKPSWWGEIPYPHENATCVYAPTNISHWATYLPVKNDTNDTEGEAEAAAVALF